MRDIDEALKEMPECCLVCYDPLYHHWASDLVCLVQYQIDLRNDEEESRIRTFRQLQECQAFVKKWGKR